MWDELLPVSLVSEIIFCPRNFYYRACEGAEGVNKFTLEGTLQDEKRNERIFEIQSRFLAKVLTGEIDEYVPFIMR